MKERLGLLVVVLLVVANVFLIPLAFQNAQGPAEGAGEPVPTGEESTDSGSTIAQDGTGGQPADAAPLLMASGGQLIVGATRGSCAGGVDLYLGLSADRGKTLRTVELDPTVTAVLAIEVTDKRVVVLAADQACRTVGYESRDRGKSWKSVNPRGRWHLDGSPGAKRVHSPDGPVPTPCAPKAMSVVRNDVVRLLCPDGRILRNPGGQSWASVGQVDGAVAIRFPTPETGFALARQRSCASAVMRTSDSGATWERVACLEGEPARGISGQDGTYAAVVGDSVKVSNDEGEHWENP